MPWQPSSRFTFVLYKLVSGTTCTYRPIEVTREASTLAEAIGWLDTEHPGHHVAEHTRGLWRVEESAAGGTADTPGSNPGAPTGA